MTNKKQHIPVFILAGGMGTRISEETHLKPKPMIEIGETPILVHLMRWYYSFGFDDFVICAGYRSWEIKNYFLDYQFRQNHLVIDHRESLGSGPATFGLNLAQEKWRVRVIDTGVDCMTGARIARAFDAVSKTDRFSDFAVTYGDGLSDVNLEKEFQFHQSHGRVGTVLGVPPAARFGELGVNSEGMVTSFQEKPQSLPGLINGGFLFFKNEFRSRLETTPDCILERVPLSCLADDGEMMVFPHRGFWYPMDTLRDKIYLQSLWESGKAPWILKESQVV